LLYIDIAGNISPQTQNTCL